jgi:uncharacterized protein YgiM (DUF1202 family)
MFKLTALLCAAMFAVFLIAGEDRGQLRPGLANAARVAAETPAPIAEPAPVVVAATPAAPQQTADVAPVDTPVTVDPVTTPETETAIEETVFSLANYGDNPPADQTATAASSNVGTVGYVDAEEVNVRQGPGTDNPVLTRLNRGEAVTIVSTDASGWARIRIEGDGIEGFMSMDYLAATP